MLKTIVPAFMSGLTLGLAAVSFPILAQENPDLPKALQTEVQVGAQPIAQGLPPAVAVPIATADAGQGSDTEQISGPGLAAEQAPASASPSAGGQAPNKVAIINDQVQGILQQMSRAVRELDYQGLATYEYGDSLDSFRVVHKVIDGVENERLLQLNGLEREIISRGRSLACVGVGDQLLRGASLRLGDRLLQLSDFYRYRIIGLHRVAGREVFLLGVEPRDEFRYGYVLGIDRNTSLPIMMELVGGPKRKVLERFQFVDLQVGDVVSELQLVPSSEKATYVSHEGQCPQQSLKNLQTWQASWLPAGFVFSGQQQAKAGGDLLMYTDGLNALSVFIEPIGAEEPVVEGLTRRGATSLVMRKLVVGNNNFSLTLIGELPIQAVQRIAESIQVKGVGGAGH